MSSQLNKLPPASALTGTELVYGIQSTNDVAITTAQFAQFITGGVSPVTSVNGRTGAVTLSSSDVTGALGYVPVSPTSAASTYAPKVSPALTGTPTAPTATVGTNTNQIATTAFVLANSLSAGVASFNTRTGNITLTGTDISGALGYTPVNSVSPSFSGSPTAPTATTGNNSSQIATTAFVAGQASTSAPVMDGSAAAGSSLYYARADHVHPSDTSRLSASASALMSDYITGTNTTKFVTAALLSSAVATFQTYSAAQAAYLDPLVNIILLEGYGAAGDGGCSSYLRVASQPSHAGKLQSADGTWWKLNDLEILPQQFGAIADCTGVGVGTVNDTALNNWFSTMCALRATGRLKGKYRRSSSWQWVLNTNSDGNLGLTIEGYNAGADAIIFDAGYGLTIAGPSEGDFFWGFSKFSINGTNPSDVMLRLGTDDFTGVMNGCTLDRIQVNNYAQNSTTRSASIGIRANYFIFSRANGVVVNCGGSGNPAYPATTPGFGTGWEFRQISGSKFDVPGAGNCNIAFRFKDGYDTSSVFDGVDIEETCIGVQNDVATSNGHIFNGGAIVASYPFADNVVSLPRYVFTNVSTSIYSGGALFATTTFTATTTNTSPTLTVPASIAGAGLFVGQVLTGTGIPTGTTISALNYTGSTLTTITMSANATATASGVSIIALSNRGSFWNRQPGATGLANAPSFASTFTSGVAWQYLGGHRIMASIGGGTISSISVTKLGQSPQGLPGGLTGDITVILDNGDYLTPSFTGSPSWTWFLLD